MWGKYQGNDPWMTEATLRILRCMPHTSTTNTSTSTADAQQHTRTTAADGASPLLTILRDMVFTLPVHTETYVLPHTACLFSYACSVLGSHLVSS